MLRWDGAGGSEWEEPHGSPRSGVTWREVLGKIAPSRLLLHTAAFSSTCCVLVCLLPLLEAQICSEQSLSVLAMHQFQPERRLGEGSVGYHSLVESDG